MAEVIYFHVLITIRAEQFKTFVILSRHKHVTRGAISHLFADCLIAFQLVRLMFFETRATSKVSVARLARNSIFSIHTRRYRLAVATRLSTLMRHATSTPFITTATHILSQQRTRKVVNNMKMSTSSYTRLILFSDSTCPSKCPRNSIPRKQRSCTL